MDAVFPDALNPLPSIGAPVVGALGVLSPVTTIVFAMLLFGTDRSPLKVRA